MEKIHYMLLSEEENSADNPPKALEVPPLLIAEIAPLFQ